MFLHISFSKLLNGILLNITLLCNYSVNTVTAQIAPEIRQFKAENVSLQVVNGHFPTQKCRISGVS